MARTPGLFIIVSLALVAVVSAGVEFTSAQSAATSYPAADRYGLKGLKGFYVLVDSLPYDVEALGLTKTDIQRDVELQLRKGGAIVLTREQAADNPSLPRLHVRLMTGKPSRGDFYNYSIIVNFAQGAVLIRDQTIAVDAITWSKAGMGMAKKKELADVRKVIGEIVDAFLNTYLAENPKM